MILAELIAGASNAIIKEVTLLAVPDMGELESVDSMEEASSCSAPPGTRAAALAFPKLNFHFDGFLLTEVAVAGALEGAAGIEEAEVGGYRETKGLVELSSGVGKGYMDTGSYGRDLREEAEADKEVEEPVRPESFDVLLISRAKDCEATARVASVSSFGVLGAVAAPLPFLAPRFLRL